MSGIFFDTDYYTPDAGEITGDGESLGFGGPKRAAQLGIEVVHQDLSLIMHGDVVQNLYLNRELRSSYNTTGAGDCFAAACLHARLAPRLDWKEAIHFANCAAAISTRRLGAQSALPTADQVAAYLLAEQAETSDPRPRNPRVRFERFQGAAARFTSLSLPSEQTTFGSKSNRHRDPRTLGLGRSDPGNAACS